MENKISKWYQSCGVKGLSKEQYEQRLEGIKVFGKSKPSITVCGELVKGFMGMGYDKEEIADFIDVFNERDISFSEESTREIPLLAGMFLLDYVKNSKEELAVMLMLLYSRGGMPYQKEIYEQIIAVYENKCMKIREIPELENIKIAAFKKISDEEKEDWGAAVGYLIARLTEQQRYIKAINANFSELREQLEDKKEESDLLWWMVADWSDIYDDRFESIGDKQSALVVPFEVMNCVHQVPGPLVVKKIIKKALSGKDLDKTYAVKDYIFAADQKILSYYKEQDYDLSVCTGFVPILELLQDKERFSKEDDLPMVYKLFGEKYDSAFLDRKISIFEFACELYYECELILLVC